MRLEKEKKITQLIITHINIIKSTNPSLSFFNSYASYYVIVNQFLIYILIFCQENHKLKKILQHLIMVDRKLDLTEILK